MLPVLLLALTQFDEGLQIGSIVLMMLESLWYVLFNVFTVILLIPADLSEAARLYQLSRLQRWQAVILPGIFPDSMTGLITAINGNSKGTIVSEYIDVKARLIKTSGLGAMISQEAVVGKIFLLLSATAVISGAADIYQSFSRATSLSLDSIKISINSLKPLKMYPMIDDLITPLRTLSGRAAYW